MKALTTPSGNFGPYKSIEVLSDRYRCDNADLPFSVIGHGTIVDASTITWPDPPAPPVVVPESVSPRQIREALMDAGLFDTVDGAVAASGDRKLQNWWEFATEFQRNNPHVLAMAKALGVTDAQLDGIWILAGSL